MQYDRSRMVERKLFGNSKLDVLFHQIILIFLKTISFPKDYGYPYGIGGGYFFDTFVLQMHYINNDLDQSVYDNSAVVFTVTSHLRTYNISTLAIGGTVNWQALAIPPKTDLMRTYFYCFSSCINVTIYFISFDS